MRLIASRSTGTGTGAQVGDTILQLLPGGTTSTNARFYLRAGNHSYVDSMSNGVILGTNLKVGNDGKGKIQGNGINISNTADGVKAGPEKNITINPGYGKSGTFSIPQVGMTNGRPKFTNHTITITMPPKPTDYSKAISDLQTSVASLLTDMVLVKLTVSSLHSAYNKHTHKLSGSAAYVISGVPGTGQAKFNLSNQTSGKTSNSAIK